MRKLILLRLDVICLVGCYYNGAEGRNSGIIDCYGIRVTEGGITVFSETYSAGYSKVYEYKSADGEKIYTSTYFHYFDSNTPTQNDSIIRAYPDKYTSEFKEYSFSKFIGFLTRENNYYLDLGARTIDAEIKWSEYKYTTNPTSVYEDTPNNKEAFNCAKSNYYQDFSSYNSQYITLRLDLTESTSEMHTDTSLGENSIITYTAKWY